MEEKHLKIGDIKEYKLLSSDEISDLNKVVNWEISEGWEPLGSASVSSYAIRNSFGEVDYGFICAQAMVKRIK
jgi:hypothetical protein